MQLTDKISEFNQENDKNINSFQKKINTYSNIQAQPDLFRHINLIDCYGNKTTIENVASIVAIDVLTLTIKPWDVKNIKNIEKAITSTSNLDVDTKTQGSELYVVFPPMSQERRDLFIKNIKALGENCKISLRKNRTNIINQIKNEEKLKNISKDDSKKFTENITKSTQEYDKKIDTLIIEKQKSLNNLN